MPKFIPYNHDQHSMIVINFKDQLQPGTFEHAIHYLIHNKIDLSIFDDIYRNSENGRPAYDPAILLSVILFAYSKGITSSREIQWCCETNIIFKALSCDTVPHFTTITAFISGHPQKIELLEELSARLSQEAAEAVVEARTARGLPVENVGHHVPIVQVLNVDELHVVISVETIRLEEDDAHAYLVAASAALRCLDEAAPIDDIQGIPRRFWRMMIGDLDAKHQP